MTDTIQSLNAEADIIQDDIDSTPDGPAREALFEELKEVMARLQKLQNRRTTRAHNIAG